MLEVKDKNLSAVKCQLAIQPAPRRSALEQEWARYKYPVLEHALAQEISPGHAENTALHIWGYFRDQASEQEKTGLIQKQFNSF